jgi:predicted dithiol-disulfide oxidoreductase (DUF899 family)
MDKPEIVSADEWQAERSDLLTAEKEATRLLDRIAARRRRLPMVRFENSYVFDSPSGPTTLLDLFQDQPQLAVYQFMNNGPGQFCGGCTHFSNNVADLDTLQANGVAWATVSDMPLSQIEPYRAEKGWTMPFVSSAGTSFAADCDASEGFMLTMFMRDNDDIYRTYNTTQRGVDRVLFANNILDLAVYGRQEDWEDSPAGWPQFPTYG